MKTEWILCPVCGNKTRTMIQENTEMRNFPLYCPKCKKETSIGETDGATEKTGTSTKIRLHLKTGELEILHERVESEGE